jgi:hypothetical protein
MTPEQKLENDRQNVLYRQWLVFCIQNIRGELNKYEKLLREYDNGMESKNNPDIEFNKGDSDAGCNNKECG